MTISRLVQICRQRFLALFRKQRLDDELDRELSFHLELLEKEHLEAGMSASEARSAARKALGNVTAFKEQCRDERRVGWIFDFLQDLHYGGRMMCKHPGFTAIAAISLAVGIGGNAAILNVAAALFWGRLPLPDAERLVIVQVYPEQNPGQGSPASIPDYMAWRERNHTFQSMGVSLANQQDLAGDAFSEVPERIAGLAVTPSLFEVLQVQPHFGRLLTDEDAPMGMPAPVIILSDRLWQRRFGGDPKIVGKKIRMDGQYLEVIGIMPAGFWYPLEKVEYWVPLAPTQFQLEASAQLFLVTGRLKSGTTMAEAQTDLSRIAGQLAQEVPDRHKGWNARVVGLRDYWLGWVRQPFVTLEGALIFVLLISCANVATLLLSRIPARQPEITMRLLMGARRGRIIRQFLTESLLLSLIGGALGLPVAWWGMESLKNLQPPLGRISISSFGENAGIIGLAAMLAILSSLLFGLLPALVAFSSGNDVRQTTAHRRHGRLAGILVSLQVGLALVLLISSGLLINSFVRLALDDRGFDPRGILSFEYRIPLQDFLRSLQSYRGLPSAEITPPTAQIQRVYERLKTLPGAESVAGSSAPAVNGIALPTAMVSIEGKPAPDTAAERAAAVVVYFFITDGFFKTLKTPLLRGREFDSRDTRSEPWGVVINETMAERFWPGEDPIGKRFTVDAASGEQPREVIGIVHDVALRYIRSGPPQPVAYALYLQQPERYEGFNGARFGQMVFLIRSNRDLTDLANAAPQAVAEVDPKRPLASVRPLIELVSGDMLRIRYNAMALTLFALMATLLASVGVYGVVSASVAQRTREIGIRLAMGARARDTVKLVSAQTSWRVAIGLLSGSLASLVLTRMLQAQLWGISATDPMTFAAVIVLLSAVSLAACFIPARRALRVVPMKALRVD